MLKHCEVLEESEKALICATPGAKCLNDLKNLLGQDQLREAWYELTLKICSPGIEEEILDSIEQAIASLVVDYGDGNLVDRYDADGKVVPYPCPDCGELEPLFLPGAHVGPRPDDWGCMDCLMHRLRDDDSPNALKARYLTAKILDEAGGPSELDVAIGDLEGTWATS